MILRKQLKQAILNFYGPSKIYAVVITIIMYYNEILRHYQKSMQVEMGI